MSVSESSPSLTYRMRDWEGFVRSVPKRQCDIAFCLLRVMTILLLYVIAEQNTLILNSSFSFACQDLEARVKALEEGAVFNATQEAVREREAEFLAQLREIKEAVAEERKQGGGGASSEEVKSLKQENELLKAKLAKSEYRVRHLIAGMEDLLAAKAKA